MCVKKRGNGTPNVIQVKLCTEGGSLRSWRSCEKAENSMRRIRFLAPIFLLLLNLFNMAPEIDFAASNFSAFPQDRQLRRLGGWGWGILTQIFWWGMPPKPSSPHPILHQIAEIDTPFQMRRIRGPK